MPGRAACAPGQNIYKQTSARTDPGALQVTNGAPRQSLLDASDA
jgi:hypothetical protein